MQETIELNRECTLTQIPSDEVKCVDRWLYVVAVIDLFSRRVVGWSMSAGMTAQLVTDALVMAIWRRGKPDALLHHSDRGSQSASSSSG